VSAEATPGNARTMATATTRNFDLIEIDMITPCYAARTRERTLHPCESAVA
jgi:hypothetical protein